jgi:Initiator Replication protein
MARDKSAELILRKPSSALGITPIEGVLSSMSLRAYTAMMFLARSQLNKDEERVTFSASLSQINEGIDGNKESSQYLKKQILEMISTVVQWEAPSPSDDLMWGACSLLSQVVMRKKGGEVQIEWNYAPAFRQELVNPMRYAQISETSLKDLKESSSYTLYEICARYKDNPSELTNRRTWQWWYLALSGKAKSTAVSIEYKYFKRDTLNPSINAVLAFSEIDIELIEHKVGRKVVDLQFRVIRKKPLVIPYSTEEIEQSALKQGLSKKTIKGLLDEYGDVKFAIALQKMRIRLDTHKERINYPDAWVRSVLENEKIEAEASAEAGTVTNDDLANEKPATPKVDKKIESFNTFYHSVSSQFDNLQKEEKEKIVQKLIEHLVATKGSNLLIQKLKQGHWELPMSKSAILKYYWIEIEHGAWMTSL